MSPLAENGGKLYIFGGAGSKAAFLLDGPGNTRLADKYWLDEVLGSNSFIQRSKRAVGCASTPAPTSQLAVSRAAVMNASNADTNQYAPVELKSARDKLIAAEQAMAAKNYELAQQLATEAQVDARLAESRTQSAKAQKAAQDSQDATGVLREELNRKAP